MQRWQVRWRADLNVVAGDGVCSVGCVGVDGAQGDRLGWSEIVDCDDLHTQHTVGALVFQWSEVGLGQSLPEG